MPTQILMPQLGESVVEGTVSRWLKQEGDTVQAYEPLLEISTDKVETEIPAPAAGVLLQILVVEGQTVGKGTLLGVIGEAMPLTPDPSPSGRGETNPETVGAWRAMPAEQQEGGTNGHAPFVTPVVARMAADYGVDLSRIQGSGRGGRVTKKDVKGYLAQPLAGEALTPSPSPSGRGEQNVDAVSADVIATDNTDDLPPWERPGSGDLFKPSVEYGERPLTPNPSPTQAGSGEKDGFVGAGLASPAESNNLSTSPVPHNDLVGTRHAVSAETNAAQRLHPIESIPQTTDDELIPISPMRRAIADHMTRSVKTSPHVTTVFEVDLSAVVTHREAHKADFAAQGVNLTFTAYFAAAAIEALRAVPLMNATWTDDGIRQHRAAHLGIAVSVTDGLIVPVIRNAGDLNLLGLARAINDVANRARAKALKPDETQGGTFTITNHGVGGSLFATPIINQPQTGIMGVGTIEKRVKVITDERGNDMLSIRPCCYVSLTFDHRTADGALGDAFLLVVKRRLDGWQS